MQRYKATNLAPPQFLVILFYNKPPQIMHLELNSKLTYNTTLLYGILKVHDKLI